MKSATRNTQFSETSAEGTRPLGPQSEPETKLKHRPTAEDNPVRLYLVQMSAFPMLSRDEELAAARDRKSVV